MPYQPKDPTNDPIDPAPIRAILNLNKKQIRQGLRMCAHCALCAESCFLYMAHPDDPSYMPSYKFINSIGLLYKKKGEVGKEAMAVMGDLVFEKCVLCTRCYCPFGIDIPALITLGRRACRSQGVFRVYDGEDPAFG
jgi:Fe-S oxidoreductase